MSGYRDCMNEVRQKAFELGGLEDGSYHLEDDELEHIIQLALSRQTEQQPVAFRECRVISFRPGMGEVTFYVKGGVPGFMDPGCTIYVSDAAPITQTAPHLKQNGLTNDGKEAAMQKAFELGGLEDGSYHLESDELELVIRSALSTMTTERDKIIADRKACWEEFKRFRRTTDETERELIAERDGANERAQMILDAKNHWVDRARAAECQRDQLRAEVEALCALLIKSLPIVEAHAGASHMLEGFRPTRNKWDELADEIRATMSANQYGSSSITEQA